MLDTLKCAYCDIESNQGYYFGYCIGLLIIGEPGRFVYVTIFITGHDILESNELDRDMLPPKDTFMYVIQHFAAFATGLLTLLFFLFSSAFTDYFNISMQHFCRKLATFPP